MRLTASVRSRYRNQRHNQGCTIAGWPGTPTSGKVGSSLCSPVPIFPGTHVLRYLCYPVPMSMFPGTYIPRDLCYPGPMLPGTYVPRYLYSPVPVVTNLGMSRVIRDLEVWLWSKRDWVMDCLLVRVRPIPLSRFDQGQTSRSESISFSPESSHYEIGAQPLPRGKPHYFIEFPSGLHLRKHPCT